MPDVRVLGEQPGELGRLCEREPEKEGAHPMTQTTSIRFIAPARACLLADRPSIPTPNW